MTGTIAIGLGAGLASGLLYGSVFTGSPVAIILFYLAPLPLFLAGLGWGWSTAAIGAAAGAVTASTLFYFPAGLFFLATCGAPAAWLAHLAMLSRPGEAGAAVEWYPAGRLLSRIALLATGLAAAGMVVMGPDYETYRSNVRAVVDEMVRVQPELEEGLGGGDGAGVLADYIAQLLLPATVAVWMLGTAGNLWLAGRVLRASGRLGRPWPRLPLIDLPRHFLGVLALAMAASLLPGTVGLIGAAVATVWVLAYFLVGLAVLHSATEGLSARPMLLAGLYFSLVVFMVAALVVAIIGIAEPLFRIREKARAQRPPAAGAD